MFIIFETPLKAGGEMLSLGTKLSQAHLKPQVRAHSKQGQTSTSLTPFPSLESSAEARLAASYVWLISAILVDTAEEGWREVMGRSLKYSLRLELPSPHTLSLPTTTLFSRLGLFSQQLTKAAEKYPELASWAIFPADLLRQFP